MTGDSYEWRQCPIEIIIWYLLVTESMQRNFLDNGVLVISKATDIHFLELRLAPVTRDIQDYQLILRRKWTWQEVHVPKIEKRFKLYCFFENKVHFYFIILVNTKTTTPSQGRCLALDISLDASRLGIYIYIYIHTRPFTSPLGDRC